MANDREDLTELLQRVEALEELVSALRGRIDSLEAASGGPPPDFHMADEAPTI